MVSPELPGVPGTPPELPNSIASTAPSQLAPPTRPRTLLPPAAKHFVQQTFRLGCAMRKALSLVRSKTGLQRQPPRRADNRYLYLYPAGLRQARPTREHEQVRPSSAGPTSRSAAALSGPAATPGPTVRDRPRNLHMLLGFNQSRARDRAPSGNKMSVTSVYCCGVRWP